MNSSDKIYTDYNRLLASLEQRRKIGEKVVFTNGCFDLIHAGHVSYLEEAKSLGDILIVALNADESVRKLKGPHRPIVNQQDRQRVIAAMASVDFVTLFAEDTPFDLIRLLLPDVLVKGGDWQIADIVGSDVVIQNGGQVRSLKFIEGNSTTNIEQKIILGYLSQFSESRMK